LLDRDTVSHVAQLACIALDDDEFSEMRSQLAQILDLFESLSLLQTDQVEPTARVVPLELPLRDDEAKPSLSQDQVLQNAPRIENGHIVVPAVLTDS